MMPDTAFDPFGKHRQPPGVKNGFTVQFQPADVLPVAGKVRFCVFAQRNGFGPSQMPRQNAAGDQQFAGIERHLIIQGRVFRRFQRQGIDTADCRRLAVIPEVDFAFKTQTADPGNILQPDALIIAGRKLQTLQFRSRLQIKQVDFPSVNVFYITDAFFFRIGNRHVKRLHKIAHVGHITVFDRQVGVAFDLRQAAVFYRNRTVRHQHAVLVRAAQRIKMPAFGADTVVISPAADAVPHLVGFVFQRNMMKQFSVFVINRTRQHFDHRIAVGILFYHPDAGAAFLSAAGKLLVFLFPLGLLRIERVMTLLNQFKIYFFRFPRQQPFGIHQHNVIDVGGTGNFPAKLAGAFENIIGAGADFVAEGTFAQFVGVKHQPSLPVKRKGNAVFCQRLRRKQRLEQQLAAGIGLDFAVKISKTVGRRRFQALNLSIQLFDFFAERSFLFRRSLSDLCRKLSDPPFYLLDADGAGGPEFGFGLFAVGFRRGQLPFITLFGFL